MLTKIEFYTCPDGTINMQKEGDSPKRFDESCRNEIQEMLSTLRELYPVAVAALADEYALSARNKSYFEYKIVHRFIRCNFGEFDTLSFDVDHGSLNVEKVKCPLRGECKLEGIVCLPERQTKLTSREMEIVECFLRGLNREETAMELQISPYTVTRHLQIIRQRLGLKQTSQIIAYFRNEKLK